MDSSLEAYITIGMGAALLAFAVAAATLLYISGIPTTTLTVQTKLGPLQIQDVPDPSAVAAAAIKALALLVLGVVGGKLLEIGLRERREAKRYAERQSWQQYQDLYYQQQY